MDKRLIKNPLLLNIIVLCFLLVGCGSRKEAKTGEVQKVVENIIEADNNKDIEKVMSLYADDAILLPPGEDRVKGHASIRPRYEKLFKNFDLHLETKINETRVNAGRAFVSGTNGGFTVSLQDSSKNSVNDKYLMVLELLSDNQWKITYLIWNQGPGEQ